MGYHIPADHHGPTPAEARAAKERHEDPIVTKVKCASVRCETMLPHEWAQAYAHCPACIRRMLE